jgi:hypothetical protein
MEDDFMVAGFWEPIETVAPPITGGAIVGALSQGGRPRGAQTGQARDNEDGVGHLNALDAQERAYLTDLFYNTLRASGGIHFLYNTMRADGKVIPWRKVVAFHKAQTVNQKSRPAKPITKSLAVMPKLSELWPCKRIGLDVIIMQGGTGDNDNLTGRPNPSMADRGKTAILNVIDYATRRSFPYALKRDSGAENARAITEWVREVRNLYYGDEDSDEWPIGRDMIVTMDNARTLGNQFRAALDAEMGFATTIRYVEIQASQKNQNPVVENSNKQVRNILRRLVQANRATNERPNSNKAWQSHWYGDQGRQFNQMRKLINERPDAALGHKRPVDVWDAYVANDDQVGGGDTATPAQKALIDSSRKALMDDATRRRGPSQLKEDKYFVPGGIVRRVSDTYVEATTRSNLQKMSGRWSDELYEIVQVFRAKTAPGTTDRAPPTYSLRLHAGVAPANFKVDRNQQKQDGSPNRNYMVSINRFGHDRLQRVIGLEDTPQNLMDGAVEMRLQTGDEIELGYVRVRYPQPRGEVPEPAFEIWYDDQLLQQQGITNVAWNDMRFYRGRVRNVNGIDYRVDIPEDNSSATINTTRPNRRGYVRPDYWRRV